MPELPEVETMVRGIRPAIVGRCIRSVRRCRIACKPIAITPAFPAFAKRLTGERIAAVRRLGKRVLLDVSDAAVLVIEPRMTGLVLVADPPDVEHLRIEFRFDDDGPPLWFWDRRGLGTVRIYSPAELQTALGNQRLGPDALDMTVADWKSRCAATARPIKVALLDQKLVAGIGNLYASEILHLAGIHPERPSSSLTASQIARLHDAIQEVLRLAIEMEGSTLGDGTYRNALNQNGSYQNHHRVYDRTDDVCPTCHCGRILRIVQAQRSTFFCPQCQRAPRISASGGRKSPR